VSTTFWTVPTQNLKNLNKHAIIDLIRFTSGGVSRVELARQMGLTRAAVTSIVDDLQSVGLVRETEGTYPSGRRPIVLEINPGLGHVIGIDMGAAHVMLILADFSGREVHELQSELNINEGPEICLARVADLTRQLLNETGMTIANISAIGVGVPGPIVQSEGMVSGPPIMPGWDRYPIRNYLEQLWGVPVSLNNDAELGAVGEWAYGAGRGERNLAYIKVGTGIGAGLLLDGQIYRGATGCAGEIGHITIDENGPLCTCGNRGCLEAIAGGGAIVRKVIEAVKAGQRTQLTEAVNSGSLKVADVMNAARHGDHLAQRIIAEAGMHFGTAVANVVNLFNPSMVVVGGSVGQIGDLLLEPIRLTVQRRSLLVASRNVRISAALLGRSSCGIGAVVQALSISLHQIADS
jgi:glucokinase-like ROK family protein